MLETALDEFFLRSLWLLLANSQSSEKVDSDSLSWVLVAIMEREFSQNVTYFFFVVSHCISLRFVIHCFYSFIEPETVMMNYWSLCKLTLWVLLKSALWLSL